MQAARLSAIEASIELQDPLLGPTMILRPMVRPASPNFATLVKFAKLSKAVLDSSITRLVSKHFTNTT